MDRDRIGQHVEQRQATLGAKWTVLAQRAGISTRTITNIRQGEKVSDDSLRALSRALGWDRDALHRIGDGGPAPADEGLYEDRLERLEDDVEQVRTLVAELLRRLDG